VNSSRAIVLLAHGARDPEWARPLEAMAERLRGLSPGTEVVLSFLEFMSPTLEQAIEKAAGAGARDIQIVPVFLAQGGHVKRDLPEKVHAARASLATSHPKIEISLLPAIGEQPDVIQAIAASIASLTQPR
jgi:sirohydrochlorin cobaltochelatase